MLDAITISPATGQSPQGLLVILHGWGANAQDVAALASYINLPDYQLVFPNAPFSHPYAPAGRMWYSFPENFNFLTTPGFENRDDLSTSRQLLRDWLPTIAASTGVPLQQTILAGFSQGGAMTLDVGVNQPIAGLMILSGYLHSPIRLEQMQVPPVLMVHGRQDSVVPLSAAQQARDSLLAVGATVQYQEFEMGHEIQLSALERVQTFVREILPPK